MDTPRSSLTAGYAAPQSRGPCPERNLVSRGPDYPVALARALEYPDADDEDGGTLDVSSGELAIFSAATDGAGPYSMPLLTARPGIVPPVHGPPPSHEMDPSLLFPSARTAYKLKNSLVHRTR